jgi:hypothetical protein
VKLTKEKEKECPYSYKIQIMSTSVLLNPKSLEVHLGF